MVYVGSKSRIAKHILPIILKNRRENQCYIEPFCGGCNVVDKVGGNRIASDINHYLIEMFRALVSGWEPPDFVSQSEYEKIKQNPNNYDPSLVGFVGFCCTFSGKWFGGYARGKDNNGRPRNYCLERKRNLLNQVPDLIDVLFVQTDYRKLLIPPNSLIYCDPPYKGTKQYGKQAIDQIEFWNWCITQKKLGHEIFISEYEAPSEFQLAWEKEIYHKISNETRKGIRKIDKLFTI